MAEVKFDAVLDEKGKEGEEAFKKWLDDVGISYVGICQARETFAKLFQNTTKRQDFFLLFESIGLIAVDVKKYTQGLKGYWPLPYENELKRVLTFERLFRIPVWYAYYRDGKNWLWISALKAVEVGKIIENNREGNPIDPFLSIKETDFLEISTNEDFGKLFAMRLKVLKQIADQA